MKGGVVAAGLLMVVTAFAVSAFASGQYVEIKKPFADVYEFLDPKSKILVHAKRGDSFELVYAGTSWYQVKVQDKVGWLERRSGEVVSSTSRIPIIPILGFLLVISAALGVTFYVIQRQRPVVEA